jgi:hypothetical protein
MKITKVTVKYGRTFSLPGYSNVKPEVGYEAEVEPGEDREAVKAELLAIAKAEVEEECDQALESGGNPAQFWQGPRFDALRLNDERFIAIVPAKMELPEAWKKVPFVETGWRFEQLLDHLKREWSSYDIQDCGLPEVLPTLLGVQLILTRHVNEGDPRYCIALPYDLEVDDLGQQYRYLPRRYHTVFAENAAAFISKYAQDNEATLIDCLDGDLSKLPDLTPKEAPATEIEPDMDEPIEDDDLEDDDYNEDDDDNGEDELSF